MSAPNRSRSMARFGLSESKKATRPAWNLSLGEGICWAGLFLGGAIFLGGLAWHLSAKPIDVWTEQQAEEFEAASRAMHGLANTAGEHDHTNDGHGSKAHEHDHGSADQITLDRFAKIEGELQEALYQQDTLGIRMMQAGMLAVIGFGIGLRSASSS
ncbi:hypothetical protein [Adhaeretor mobilis]|uniref:Uncharacterized protein n=1 Tax=Adhaeretor mobilis TaxID=1930276 RepID=A0A517MQV4_9BACT|nr:hypothetical protein [Adhaeretor mobilis]QDS97266.1 hypothetical protein HG15A2_05270 [Adhaeretor mobilis]